MLVDGGEIVSQLVLNYAGNHIFAKLIENIGGNI
jgi:hypothetical protein